MNRLRGNGSRPAFSYAESPSSSPRDAPSSPLSVYEDAKQSFHDTSGLSSAAVDSEDELTSDDVIHAVPRGTAAQLEAERQLPARSRRANVQYTRPVPKPPGQSKTKRRAAKKKLLASDTIPETARNKIRNEIAAHTKPKRDAFFLSHKDYFQPLLPDNSYIDKLERANAAAGTSEPTFIEYVPLHVQPSGVKATMKPYQLDGLSFLLHMHENGMSAILGDEMGLGKTLQTLALFQHLAEHKPITGEDRPNLVVCPLSVLSSWMAEARKWVPNINVIRFHGPKSERDQFKKQCLGKNRRASSLERIDLVITTYETFCAEQGWFKRAFVWRYCVLDEGHKIKNEKSDISSALQGLRCEYRLLLTGTPLQNNLKEMWALLHWLFPDVFNIDTADNFKKAFDLTKGTVSTTFMDDARRLLELIMMRRLKSSPEVNLGLPPKEEVLLYVPLTPMQRFWYTRLLTNADNATLENLFAGAKDKESEALRDEQGSDNDLLKKASAAVEHAEEVDTTDVWAESRAIMQEAIEEQQAEQKTNAWRKLMNLIMQLRKACNHPYLLPHAAPRIYDIGDHVKNASGKFIVLDKLLDELVVNQRKKVLIFSGFTSTLNLVEELLHLKGAAVPQAPFRFARLDGGTGRAMRNLSIRLFNDMQSDYQVMLLSTRAGGLGINLTSATDVVFMDEDWNPQVTLQAEARAHRIGQTKKVTVYKLCSSGTVEEQMMGRIRKKLYLSAKVMESMRSIHSSNAAAKKRKRSTNEAVEDDTPQLDTASLQSLIRRGAQTLTRPKIDVTEMLNWDWATTLEKCKDRPVESLVDNNAEVDEETWLNSMEKVETAVFEGKRHQKQIEKQVKEIAALNRGDRRVGKNTTVEIDGFMINKESLNCADWEAVPTFAGKDPRLAEFKKEKRPPITHQEHCQVCWNGEKLTLCSGCPRAYHPRCLSKEQQVKANGMSFHCSQHECHDCGSKTSDAGGLVYRCRWCEKGFCEDCLDWEKANMIDFTLPEFEMLGFGQVAQAFYIECPRCVESWENDSSDKSWMEQQKTKMRANYETFLENAEDITQPTPDTISEAATPVGETPSPHQHSSRKKTKYSTEVIVLD